MVNSSIDTILRYIEQINVGDIEQVYAMTHDGVEFIDAKGDMYIERDFMTNYMAAFPKYQIHVEQILSSGNGVAFMGKTSGSHVPPEIEERETLIWTVEIARDQIAHWRIYATDTYRIGE